MRALMLESGSSSCALRPASVPSDRWIALVDKGTCKLAFVLSAPLLRNASAIVVYSQDDVHEMHSRRLKCKHIFNFNTSNGVIFTFYWLVAGGIVE